MKPGERRVLPESAEGRLLDLVETAIAPCSRSGVGYSVTRTTSHYPWSLNGASDRQIRPLPALRWLLCRRQIAKERGGTLVMQGVSLSSRPLNGYSPISPQGRAYLPDCEMSVQFRKSLLSLDAQERPNRKLYA